MGCIFSSEPDHKFTTASSINISPPRNNEVKLLLLGAAESGKSTVLKQMQLIYGIGFSNKERRSYKPVIYKTLITSTLALYTGCTKHLSLCPVRSAAFDHAYTLLYQTDVAKSALKYDVFPSQIASAITTLLSNPQMQIALSRSSEFQLDDSAHYYFSQLNRISMPTYVPSDQDILRARIKTCGITETTFVVDKTYQMIDVGGQRSERRKWIHCFDNVSAIIFLVALSEVLIEDESVNRMLESLALFDSICNSRWFLDTNMILFFNKIDLFKSSLIRSPLRNYFPDYTGDDGDFDASCDYFIGRFLSLNRSSKKQVYPHFTCATDSTHIKFVFHSVREIIRHNNLLDAWLL